jgi:O-antigen/teichoic acid export membrane protein
MSKNYLKDVGSVLTGTVASQLIPVAGTLVLARQYSPAAFGVYSIWLGIAIFISVIITCRFETLLAIVDDGAPRRDAVFKVLSITACSTIFLMVISIVLYSFGLRSIVSYNFYFVMLAIFTAFLLATLQIWQAWLASDGLYTKLSFIRISQTGLIVLFQILYGAINQNPLALIISHILGLLVGVFLCFRLAPISYPKTSLNDLRKDLFVFWNENHRFPMYSLPADAINSAAGQIPLLIIASRFGDDSAGLFALTQRVLGAPIGLLGTAALDVFKRHASSAYRVRRECVREYKETFKILLIASLVFCIIFALIGPYIFGYLFGERWIGTGAVGLWLLPMFFLRFIASPLSYMVYIANKQHVDFFWQISLLVMTLVTLNIADLFSTSVQFYSLGYAILYIVYLRMSYEFSLGSK